MSVRERAMAAAKKAREQRLVESSRVAITTLDRMLGLTGKIIVNTEEVSGNGTIFDVAEPKEAPLYIRLCVSLENGAEFELVRVKRLPDEWGHDGGGMFRTFEELGIVLLKKEDNEKRFR